MSSLEKISFNGDLRYQKNLTYIYRNLSFLTTYLNLLYSPVNSINQTFVSNVSLYTGKISFSYRTQKKKLFGSKIIHWLDDFYLSGKDPYSKISRVMIECSQMLRQNSTTFKYLKQTL